MSFFIFFLSNSLNLLLFFSPFFSDKTNVISPLKLPLKFSIFETSNLIYSSYIFVISLQIRISLSKKNFFSIGITLTNFFADIKKTIDEFRSAKILKSLLISLFFSGKKP